MNKRTEDTEDENQAAAEAGQATEDQASPDAGQPSEDTAKPSEEPEPDLDSVIDAALTPANPGDDGDRADLKPADKDAAKDATKDAAKDAAKPADEDDDPDLTDGRTLTEQEAAEELTRDLSDAELDKFKPNHKRRIQALLQDRAKFRAKAQEFDQSADFTQPVLDAVKNHGLSKENIQELMHVGSVLRSGDYAKFAELMQPYMEQVQLATGKTLPADIQERVDDGEITLELASELARGRHSAQVAKVQQQEREQSQRRQQQRDQQTKQTNTVRDTLNAWEERTLSVDPDYSHIRTAVHEQVHLELRAHGVPKSAEEAKAVADRALARVKGLSTASRKPTAPRPPSSGPNPGSANSAEPNSLDDIINATLAG